MELKFSEFIYWKADVYSLKTFPGLQCEVLKGLCLVRIEVPDIDCLPYRYNTMHQSSNILDKFFLQECVLYIYNVDL